MSQFTKFSFSDKNDLKRNIQLEASAGTGKTYSIERIVSLLIADESLRLSQILIVTFTRKAARELKERVRQILSDASRSGFLDLGGEKRELEGKALENIRTALLEFEKASIFTIHSFCLNVLKAFPFESLSQFSMDMESGGDVAGEAVRDYLRDIGESMGRGRLIKYKAYRGSGNFEAVVENLSKAVRKELFGPGIHIIPDREECDEILEAIMDFNNSRGNLFEAWQRMKSLQPDKAYFSDLGFSYANYLENAVKKLQQISVDSDLISLSVFLSDNVTIFNQFSKFLPENLEQSMAKGQDPSRAAGDPFVRAAEDFLNEYLYDRDNPGADLYARAMKTAFLRDAYEEISKRLRRKKDITGKLDFNDLVGRLHQGLCGGAAQYRPELVNEIRHRYRTVLIDEFQDTDQRQWDIFNTLFGSDDRHNFFLVGDPKQSIYRFRGADLEVYHQACNSDGVDQRFTLGRNFRSIPSLVQGVNRFFTSVFDGRMHCGDTVRTPFFPVEAGRKSGEGLLDDGKAAFEFIQVEGEPGDKGLNNLGRSKDLYFRLIAYKSYRLLSGDRTIDGKNLNPGDIAVLAENHKDCRTIQSLLTSYSIPSIINSRERIFDTDEAGDFLIFLEALLSMNNSSIKRLLLSRFFEMSSRDILEREESGELDSLTAKLYPLRDLVDRGRIIEASRELFRLGALEQRILGEHNGERSYSNYRQLLEYLHREQLNARMDAEGLYSFLLGKIHEKGESDEDLIRLDKDSEAVQIMTMHASKGLEFPIVFFAGAMKSGKKSGKEEYYDFVRSGRRYYDFFKRKENGIYHGMDSWEERKRLYYVALTRASSKLYMPFIRNLELSYLSSLYSSFGAEDLESMIRSHDDVADFSMPIHSGLVFRERPKQKDELTLSIVGTIDEAILALAEENQSLYSIDDTLEPSFGNLTGRDNLHYRDEENLLALQYHPCQNSGFDERYTKITSYSSIVREAEYASHSDADRDEVQFLPREDSSGAEVLTRGAVLGELVHLLFEELDYSLVQDRDLSAFLKEEAVDIFFRDQSLRFFDNRWYGKFALQLKSVIYNTLKNPLSGGFSLCELGKEKRLHEMEFHMTVKECGQLLVESFSNGSVEEGLLKGFIDLIFHHEGKYYIADWKTTSSPVGDDYDSYKPEILDGLMESHHYKLQSMIYMVALYRYLNLVEGDGFDYKQNFGGCYYFFVRGMSGESGSERGVYFHRPDEGELLSFASQFTTLEVPS